MSYTCSTLVEYNTHTFLPAQSECDSQFLRNYYVILNSKHGLTQCWVFNTSSRVCLKSFFYCPAAIFMYDILLPSFNTFSTETLKQVTSKPSMHKSQVMRPWVDYRQSVPVVCGYKPRSHHQVPPRILGTWTRRTGMERGCRISTGRRLNW